MHPAWSIILFTTATGLGYGLAAMLGIGVAEKSGVLSAAVRGGDASHEQADADMRGRWKRPKKSLDWYFGVKRDFAALPED